MNTHGFFQKIQNWAYLFMSPFLVLTLIFLFSTRFFAESIIFVTLAYSVLLSCFVSGALWGVQAIEFEKTPSIDERLVFKALLLAVAPMFLTWIALILRENLIIGVVIVIAVQIWQILEVLKFKNQNRLPEAIAHLKAHPLMISLPCLILALLKLFFACPPIS